MVRFAARALSPDGKIILLPFSETYISIRIIPEFASSPALSLFMIATLLTVIVYRRRRFASSRAKRAL